MIARRGLLRNGLLSTAALVLPGCGGGGGSGSSTPTPAPTPAPTPVPSPTPTPTAASPLLKWQLEGDSYMALRDNGLYLARFIERNLRESAYNTAISGSSFSQIGVRIDAAGLRDNPLLIWDGAAVGRTLGSIELELGVVDAIVRFKAPRRNWMVISSVVTRGQAFAERVRDDMIALRRELVARHGEVHLFDALPILQSLSDGSEQDRADVALGLVPSSTLIDGLHLNASALEAVANALTPSGGPMAAVRNL